MKPLRLFILVVPLLATAACLSAEGRSADVVVPAEASDPALLHGAFAEVTRVMVHDIFSPPQASRVYAYVSVAAYEALVPTEPGYRSLAGQLGGLTPPPAPPADEAVHGPTAALHASLVVAEALLFSDEDVVAHREVVRARLRDAGVPRALARRSEAYGEAVAAHVLAWAKADQFAQTRGGPAYTVTDEPGAWRPTPPAYFDAVEPNWGRLRPFLLDSAAQFKPLPPHPYDVEPGSAFRRELEEVYTVGQALTDEQRAIAAFWDCNPFKMHLRGHAMFATKKLTPGGHWIGIAAIVSDQNGDTYAEAAEAYVRTALVLADGFLSVWDEKYRSRVVRPETVINAVLDEDWEPLLQTPPFPEYTSGHSVISAAAAEVLTDLYGEPFAFDDTTEVAFGLPVRSFRSFREAAEEAAVSRLYGGIHYRQAIEQGVKQGRAVGRLHVDRLQTRQQAASATRRSPRA